MSGGLTFRDYKKRSIIPQKEDEYGAPYAGAIFDIYKDGQIVGHGKTGQYGILEFDGNGNGLKAGYYEFVETEAPTGFLLPYNNRHGVWLEVSDLSQPAPVVIYVKNYRNPEIVIRKYVSGTTEPVAGASFEVTIGGKMFGTFGPAGPDGTIVIDPVKYSDFLKAHQLDQKRSWTIGVREVVASDGYLIDDDNWQYAELHEGNELKEFEFQDTPYPEIWVRKLDSETGKPLAGTTFNILIDGVNIGDPFVSDINGWVKITYEDYQRFLGDFNDPLPYNGWTITVTKIGAPDKYNPDTQTGGQNVEARQYTLTSRLNTKQKLVEFTFRDTSYRKVRVIKKGAETNWPLARAEFTLESVTLDNGGSYKEFLTTDSTGTVLFEDVPNGTYKLWESKAPSGYADNSEVKTVIVKSADAPIVEYEFKNAPHSGIKFLKVNAATGSPIPNCLFEVTMITPDTEGVVG